MSTFCFRLDHQLETFVTSSAHLTHSATTIFMPSVSSIPISVSIHLRFVVEQFHIGVRVRNIKNKTILEPLLFVSSVIIN